MNQNHLFINYYAAQFAGKKDFGATRSNRVAGRPSGSEGVAIFSSAKAPNWCAFPGLAVLV